MSVRLSKLPWPEIAILVAALFLRVWLIEVKPPHFDEGVNGWFADRMTETGYYAYDPTNYHGPLHFYAVFLSQTLFGRELWALRLPAIVASLLCVWAMLRFREFFGPTVARLAALAMAISPAYVFYGRYSIHESWQVLFCILLLQSILGLWRDGGRRWLYLAVGSIVGLILTKETYVLHIGCFLLAIPVLWLWQKVMPSRPDLPVAKGLWTRSDAAVASGLGVLAIVAFYSGFFHEFRRLAGLYETFSAWFETGAKANGHDKPGYDIVGPLNWYWVALMLRYEWPALAGLAACVRYVFPSDVRLRYVAIAAGGTLLAYSIISYKTPWCIISMLWPFYIVGAAAAVEGAERCARPILAWAAALPLLAGSLISSAWLNFRNYTDDREPYVYVQTYKDIERFTGPLLAAAKADPRIYHTPGVIALDSYYPLPWTLGDFTQIGYYKPDQEFPLRNAAFVVIDRSREDAIEPAIPFPSIKRRFHLRSAQEECTVYFNRRYFKDFVPPGPVDATRR
ncbi:MAG: TIGR03663 family protein [Terrimicrobiaceae bacterium]|nr:TIGR03663 family protein [Terrimicrobiaceae bacterium]